MNVASPPQVSPDLERSVAALALTHKLLSPALAARMIQEAREGTGRSLLAQLLEAVPETAVLKAVGAELGIHYYDLHSTNLEFRLDEGVLGRADMATLKRYNALPLVNRSNQVVVVVANPSDLDMLEYLRSRYSAGFSLVLASKLQIQNRLTYFDTDSSPTQAGPARPTGQGRVPTLSALPKEVGAGSSTQAWVDATLARAVAEGASDVHFLFNADKSLLLRFRVDGLLRQQRVPTDLKAMEIVGSILTRCETMDSSNYREPQDGTFSFEAAGRTIDARVGMLPQSGGPTVVIRLLDSINMRTRLDDMGFDPAQLELMRKAINASQGTILVCGPTGSGKSTTLYGLLREVDSITRNVLTVEDPVEYRLPSIGQTEIRAGLGDRSLTFARALRSILRLDPDIILVGEIRDGETAEVAMQAALTGHVVLSTTHSNSALSAYARLSDLDLQPYVVSQAVTLIIAQRLIRRVHDCARISAPTPDEVASLTAARVPVPDAVAHPVGCPGCNGTGYRGRMAVVEVLSPSRELKSLVAQGAPHAELAEAARAGGFQSLLADGLRHLNQHHTTVTELVRVLVSEEQ